MVVLYRIFIRTLYLLSAKSSTESVAQNYATSIYGSVSGLRLETLVPIGVSIVMRICFGSFITPIRCLVSLYVTNHSDLGRLAFNATSVDSTTEEGRFYS